MTVVTVENVEVGDSETEIIKELETDKNKNRIFAVVNRDSEIEVKVYGTNDGGATWEEKETKIISANYNDVIILGPTMLGPKLTGKTTNPGTTSIVDATLTY